MSDAIYDAIVIGGGSMASSPPVIYKKPVCSFYSHPSGREADEKDGTDLEGSLLCVWE
jgi:hypothetical protein